MPYLPDRVRGHRRAGAPAAPDRARRHHPDFDARKTQGWRGMQAEAQLSEDGWNREVAWAQKMGLPGSCFGDTRYFVTDVKVAEQISLSPGVSVPQPPATWVCTPSRPWPRSCAHRWLCSYPS